MTSRFIPYLTMIYTKTITLYVLEFIRGSWQRLCLHQSSCDWNLKLTFKFFWKDQSYLISVFFVNTEKWSKIFSKDEKEKGINNLVFSVFVHFQECISVVYFQSASCCFLSVKVIFVSGIFQTKSWGKKGWKAIHRGIRTFCGKG